MTKYRCVTWNLPVELYKELEKAKAEGQKFSGVPADCSSESFAMFLLDRAVKIYRAEQLPQPVIVDPFAERYVGRRTGT